MKVLVAYALRKEMVNINWPGVEVIPIVTGEGKACAALELMRALLKERPDHVINIGTAGTFHHSVGDIVVPKHFFDRDLSTTHLPGVEYNFQPDETNFAGFPSIINGCVCNRSFTISTGDNFITSGSKDQADVVDMESFAMLQACRRENVPFCAIKYVTDVIGSNSVTHWQNQLQDARQALERYFQNYCIKR